MKTRPITFAVVLAAAALSPQGTRAQETSPTATASVGVRGLDSPSATPSENMPKTQMSPATAVASDMPNDPEMMKKMMAMAKTNENHKLIADLAGTWNYTVKMWMAPDAPPMESKGTAVRKAMMDGRFFTLDVTGKMKIPGADGNLTDFEFKGHGMEGYDNAKQKFVGTWMDNMSTGIMMAEGTYDPSTKTFTYTSEVEMLPGMKQKVRELVKVTDKDHHVFEWYEDHGGQETKTMEIAYSRAR
ncbi:MAG: DUF1579 domain-containing protein [Verrucomicrobiota bacterium]